MPNVTAGSGKQADANWPSANKRRHKLHGNEACAAFITLAAFDPTITSAWLLQSLNF